MSNACNVTEFQRQFNTCLAAYALADKWQRDDALKSFLGMLNKLGYFRVGRAETTVKNSPMVEVQGFFSLAKTLPDLVQIDLERLWNCVCAEAQHAFHAFERAESGFSGHFLSVSDSTVVTLRLNVLGT